MRWSIYSRAQSGHWTRIVLTFVFKYHFVLSMRLWNQRYSFISHKRCRFASIRDLALKNKNSCIKVLFLWLYNPRILIRLFIKRLRVQLCPSIKSVNTFNLWHFFPHFSFVYLFTQIFCLSHKLPSIFCQHSHSDKNWKWNCFRSGSGSGSKYL